MSKPASSLGAKFRGWLKQHVYYDNLFYLREMMRAGWQRVKAFVEPAVEAIRQETVPKKRRPYVPSGEKLEERQLLTTVQFSSSSYLLMENGGSATISVTLDSPSAKTITIDYGTANNTATAGSDYTSASGTLTFAPSEVLKTFTVSITSDSLDEVDEVIDLALSNPSADVTLGSPTSATITIGDDDDAPTVQFNASSYSVEETAGKIPIIATLSAVSGKTITVNFATSNGSATAGSDYESNSGTLTFLPGDPATAFSVYITDDQDAESDETVHVTLTSPSNATLGTDDDVDITIENMTPTEYLPEDVGLALDRGNVKSMAFAGYQVNLRTGNLRVDVAAADQWMKWEESSIYYYPGLVYNSDTAAPMPLLSARIDTLSIDPLPTDLRARLTWDGGSPQSWVTFTLPGGSTAGDSLYFTLQNSSTVSTTDIYNFTIDVELNYSTRGTIKRTISDYMVVVANGATPYGHGWSLPDENYLLEADNDNIFLVYGDGGFSEFSETAGVYTSPDYEDLSLVYSSGTYTFTDSYGTLWNYATTIGDWFLLDTVVEVDGSTVTYTYDVDGLLTGVRDPNNTGAIFNYGSGKLSTIQRGHYTGGSFDTFNADATTTVTFDGSGNLASVADAEGNLRTFTYDSDHKLLTDADGSRLASFTYSLGAVVNVNQGSGLEIVTVVPQLLQAAGSTVARENQFVSQVTRDGDTTNQDLDAQGRLLRRVLPTGATETWTRNDAGLPLTYTDANGRTTTYTYVTGTRNVETITDPAGGVTSFLYTTAFPTPTTVIGPSGERTTYVLDGATGDILVVETPDLRRTTYTYSQGLVATIRDADNRLTSFLYDSYRQLQTTIYPDGQRVTETYSFTDDAQATLTPAGERTTTVFDQLGKPTVQIDALGNRTTFLYTVDGQLEATIEPNGNRSTTVYDTAGRIIATIDPLGNRTTTVYDAAGRVQATVDPYGNRTTNVFDDDGRRIATVDYLGNRTTTVYDPAGNILRSIDRYGYTTTFLYDTAGRQNGQIDPFNNRTTTVYNAAGNVINTIDQFGHITTNTYDANGNLLVTHDWLGHRVTNTYTAANRVETTTDQYGFTTTFIYDGANRLTQTINSFGNRTTTAYTGTGRVSVSIDEFGNRTTFHYDAQDRLEATEDRYGHFTTNIYDAAGRVEATIDVFGNRATTIYTATNQVEATIDIYGNRTTFIYDAYGRQTATVNALNQRSTTVYDSLGRVSATIDALNNRTTTVYDSYNRVAATIDALGNATTILYDAYGRPEATVDYLGNRATTVYDSYSRVQANIDRFGNRATTVYDAFGRVQATTDYLGNRSTTVFDSRGRVEAAINALGNATTFVFDSDGRQSAVIDALGNRSTTIYDSYNRVSAQIDYLSQRTTFLYDSRGRQETIVNHDLTRVTTIYDSRGRTEATIDRLGNRTTTVYNAQGDFVASIDQLGNRTTIVYDAYGRNVASVDQLGNRTTTVFDAMGRRVNLIDASNNKTTFVYDVLGRTSQETDPRGFSTVFAYDAVGRLLSRTDRLNRRIDYAYDALGRNTGETWYNSDGSTVNNRITFTYDVENRLATAADSDGTYTMVYDANHRVTRATDLYGNVLTFTYDAIGHRTKVQDSQGGTTTSVYNAIGQLTSRQFSDGVTPLRQDFSYDERGQTTQIIRYSNLAGTTIVATTDTTYNLDGQITSIHTVDGSSSNISYLTYTYDTKHRLATQKTDGTLVTYTYDTTDQVTADSNTTVTYDATGNRNNGSNTTTTGNRLSTDGTWNYTYDNDGNMTSKLHIVNLDIWTYGYDNKNHLTSADHFDSGMALLMEADYKYDVFGNRHEKIVDADGAGGGSATTTRFAYDQWNPAHPTPIGTENANVWADSTGGGSLTTRYLHGDKIDELLARIDATTPRWYVTDHLGSIRKVVNNSGVVKDSLTYDGWGNILSETDANERGRYAWTGREIDVETALQYNRARFYDATTGRWISQDPLGFDAGDSNLYRYASNRLQVDPSGLQQIDPGLRAARAIESKYRALAYKDVGIDTANADRMREENSRFVSASGASNSYGRIFKQVNVGARINLMKRIGAAYGNLYKQNQTTFVWTGFAAIALNDGVLPQTLEGVEIANREHIGYRVLDSARIGVNVVAIGAFSLAWEPASWIGWEDTGNVAREGVLSAFAINFAIFDDLYWLHLAYNGEGIAGIRNLGKEKIISAAALDAFEKIDSGSRLLVNNPKKAATLISEGNLRLFRREQEDVVTPLFNRFPTAISTATSFGLIKLPNKLLRQAASNNGLDSTWPFGSQSYGPFQQRWEWLERSGWGAFMDLHANKRQQLLVEVQRAIDGKSE